MGRPLYSLSYTAPAVRTEPEAGVSPYEKWTYWNAFDPDSDEFFESDNAVLEDFIDLDQASPPALEALTADLVGRRGGSNSSSSSEGTVSERGSPMAVGSDDPASMLAEAYPAVNWELREESANSDPARESTSQFIMNMFDVVSLSENEGEGVAPDGYQHSRSATLTMLPDPRMPRPRFPAEALPRTSSITPIPIPVGRNRATSRRGLEQMTNSPTSSPFIPSTPPSHSSFGQGTPSSGSSSTPTFLTWSRHPMTPASPTPNSGPLTNPNARMSLAHIAPTLIRAQEVII